MVVVRSSPVRRRMSVNTTRACSSWLRKRTRERNLIIYIYFSYFVVSGPIKYHTMELEDCVGFKGKSFGFARREDRFNHDSLKTSCHRMLLLLLYCYLLWIDFLNYKIKTLIVTVSKKSGHITFLSILYL